MIRVNFLLDETMNFREIEYVLNMLNEPRVKTPVFIDLMEFLAKKLDFYVDNDKFYSGYLTKSKGLGARQSMYDDLVEYLLNICNIDGEDRPFFYSGFLKLESVLSGIHAEVLLTVMPSSMGSALFYRNITRPMLKIVVDNICSNFNYQFFHCLSKLLQEGGSDISAFNVKLKKFLISCLGDYSAPDFKSSIGKMSNKSYFKFKKIDEIELSLLDELRSSCEGEDECKLIARQVRFWLIAGKVVYAILEFERELKVVGSFNNVKIALQCCNLLVGEYICNKKFVGNDIYSLSRADVGRINNSLNVLICCFKELSGCVELDDSTLMLGMGFYENESVVLLPDALLSSMEDYLMSGKCSEKYLDKFEELFKLANEKYQLGIIGLNLASAIVVCKMRQEKLPPKALEPLVTIAMEYMPVGVLCEDVSLTPFGIDIDESCGGEDKDYSYTLALNTLNLVGWFNKFAIGAKLNARVCNPFEGLDKFLGIVFSSIDVGAKLPNSAVGRYKSIIGLDVSPYDALRGLNKFLYRSGLGLRKELRKNGYEFSSSHAGLYINRYLLLSAEEKKSILAMIDQASYDRDVRAYLLHG